MSCKNDARIEKTSRRTFPKRSGSAVAGTTLASALAVRSYVGEDNTINVALVGCGGRGTEAALQAMSTAGPAKLVAMAGVGFQAVRSLVSMMVSMAQVLERVGFVSHEGSDAQLRGPCAVHGSSSPKSRSFSVNLEQHASPCFQCGCCGNQLDRRAAVAWPPAIAEARARLFKLLPRATGVRINCSACATMARSLAKRTEWMRLPAKMVSPGRCYPT